MTDDHLTSVEKVLSNLQDYKARGEEFRAKCPIHNGKSNDSLTITEGDDGRVLLTCHSGCEFDDIVAALGLDVKDTFSSNGHSGSAFKKAVTPTKPKPLTGVDDATDAVSSDDLPDGTYYEFESLSGEVIYMQRHKREYWRKIGEDRWKKGLDGVNQILYRMPELADGVRAGRLVVHTEGPKDAERARDR